MSNFKVLLTSFAILVASFFIFDYRSQILRHINQFFPFTNDSTQISQQNVQEKQASVLLNTYRNILQQVDTQSFNCNMVQNGTKNQIKKNCNMAFGYVSDVDVYVDALELMKKLNISSSDINSVFHHSLKTKREIGETFFFFFEKGAGGEFIVEDRNLFEEVVQEARKIQKKESLGGNAATMSVRGIKEGGRVILAHAMNEKYYNEIFGNKGVLVDELKEISDIHLVLDFKRDAQFGEKSSPRSNRVYLNHDLDNTKLSYMEKLNKFLKSHSNSLDIVGLGGFQLLNNKNNTEELMTSLSQEVLNLQSYGAKVHIEMGTFTDASLYKQLVFGPLLLADSLGINEQELGNLMSWLSSNKIVDAVDSETEFNQIIENLVSLIGQLKQKQFKLNRIHFHTINLQMICNDIHQWESSKLALVKSVVVSAQESEDQSSDFYEFPEGKTKIKVPESVFLPYLTEQLNVSKRQDKIKFNEANPITCWNPLASTQCCIAPSIRIVHPKKTCGLGDNISATGLIYHKRK